MENEIVRLSERMRILWSGTKVPRKNNEERNKRMETIWTPYYGVLYGRIVQRWIRLVILRELFLLSCVHLFLS